MSETKRIVILANSSKPGGRCVAGTEWDEPLNWIRPVSTRPGQEVSYEERRYERGGEPRLLDVVDITLSRPIASGVQQENWLLDPEYWWEKVAECSFDDLDESLYEKGPLWKNGASSSTGRHNRFRIADAPATKDSLRLIRVPELKLSHSRGWNGEQHLDGEFMFSGTIYRMRVTDPEFESAHGHRSKVGDCYLTISVTPPFEKDEYHYKLIAAVIPRDAR